MADFLEANTKDLPMANFLEANTNDLPPYRTMKCSFIFNFITIPQL